jgi:hypothetical protein
LTISTVAVLAPPVAVFHSGIGQDRNGRIRLQLAVVTIFQRNR